MGWVMVFAVLSAGEVSAQDADERVDASGTWEIDGSGWILEINMEGHQLSGYLTLGTYGRFEWSEGDLDGDKLRIEVNAGGNAITFEGKLDGDEYSGRMTGMHDEPFVAVRTRGGE